jgi:hypothetical protein
MREMITKSTWLAAQQCPTKAWFDLRAEPETPGEAALFRMSQGREIGDMAKELFPNGILVPGNGAAAVEATQGLINISQTDTLFEAAFSSQKLTARADILKRTQGGWHVLEVKSSFADTSSIRQLVDDLAYTVFVARRTGLNVTKASLVLLSRAYRFGNGSDLLFEILDKTVEVDARVAEFIKVADSLPTALFADTRPAASLLPACRECNFFETDCLGLGVLHSVLEIPGLHHTKLKRLSAASIIDMAQTPTDLGLNERQERARLSSIAGTTFVSPALSAALRVFQFPCYYLDFETVATVLPMYDNHSCHRQVLTQFSVHRKEAIGSDPTHIDYLADATQDCEKLVADALIDALGNLGSIVVYSSFEKTRISGLRDAYPDLATALQAILDRLADLLPVLQEHVYHPAFRGSFSIKKVLPALVPTLSYAGLEVRDGDTAIARFARMANGTISGEDVALTRKQLLDYCKLDTLAMVRLHETLHALGSANNTP